MPQAVHRQLGRQARQRPELREPVIDLAGRDPPAPLGQPHRRMGIAAIPRPHLSQVLLPAPRAAHGITVATARRRGGLPRIALPNRTWQAPNPPSSGAAGLAAKSPTSSIDRLPAAQPPPVDHLEQRRVPERRQPALPPRRRSALHPVIGSVQERLQLGAGQRPTLCPALIVRDMHRGIPLMANLHRTGTHPLLALRQPPVPGIAHIIQEHRQRALIRPDRRMRPPARATPQLHLLRRPRPRPRHREPLEPADQPLPALHQRHAQPAAALLTPPALQHRLEQRRLGPQRRHAVHQHQRGCPRDLARLRQRAPPRHPDQMQRNRHSTQPDQMPHHGSSRNHKRSRPGQAAWRPGRVPARPARR